MGIRWDFNKDFIGIAIRKDGKPEFIYSGNALMIFNAEYPDKQDKDIFNYALMNFYADKQHLKNCIKNINYDGTEYKKIILIPCEQAYIFAKEIKGLWDVEITSHKTKWMKATRTHYRKVGYKK